MLKAGDIVRLKSGGPTMTIGGFSSNSGAAIVEWFDDFGRHRTHEYPAACLDPAPPESFVFSHIGRLYGPFPSAGAAARSCDRLVNGAGASVIKLQPVE